MNVLSLFDGMSCGQIALERAGIKVDKYFASEIKKEGIKVTMANYPKTIQLGDVRNIRAVDLPHIDLLIGGSPCQDFSIANSKRLGLDGVKSGLFYEYLRIKEELLPDYFLLENVAMERSAYNTISRLMGTYPVDINSARVSAQLRQRSYWTNIGAEDFDLSGNRYCAIPQPPERNIFLADILEHGFTDRRKHVCLNRRSATGSESQRYLVKRNASTGMVTIIYDDVSCDETKGVRVATQRELERLQTVPEGYTSILNQRQACDCLGDGWTVDVIAHIFSFLPEEYKVI